MSNFSYVKYSENRQERSFEAKEAFDKVYKAVEKALPYGSREKSLVLTKLEEAYMFVGRALRREQLGQDSLEEECGPAQGAISDKDMKWALGVKSER